MTDPASPLKISDTAKLEPQGETDPQGPVLDGERQQDTIPDNLENMIIQQETQSMIDQLQSQQDEALQIKGTMYMTTGMEIFDYDQIHQKYSQDPLVLRDYNLPFCHRKVKQDVNFWLMSAPFCAGLYHTYTEMSRVI